MISFENTEIAFKNKSNNDLKKAYWLFKIVANPKLVHFGKAATNIALKLRLPIDGFIKKTIFKQFCGGETIRECEKVTKSMAEFGVKTILDYSVEGKISEEDFDATVDEIISTIEAGKKDKNIPFAVFKVTGIARFGILEAANDGLDNLSIKEKKELESVINRIERICKKAFENDQPVFIDAEETWIQNTIDAISTQMMKKYNQKKAIVFNTAQMYRHDRLVYLEKEINLAKSGAYYYGIKLVRGAYMEKERERADKMNYLSPIQPDKASTDKDFDLALELIINNIDTVSLCAGTHNEQSSSYLSELMSDKNIENNDHHIYFAQLLGMSDHISYNLAYKNYNVAKYVPYGPIKEVLPYLLRRADENTSVAGQTSRELDLIEKEKNRRKK